MSMLACISYKCSLFLYNVAGVSTKLYFNDFHNIIFPPLSYSFDLLLYEAKYVQIKDVP